MFYSIEGITYRTHHTAPINTVAYGSGCHVNICIGLYKSVSTATTAKYTLGNTAAAYRYVGTL